MSTTAQAKPFNYNLWLTVLLHTVCACCSRYELSVLNNLEPLLKNFTIQSVHDRSGHVLTSSQWAWFYALINCSLLMGSFFGCFLIRPMTDFLGRRFSVMVLKNVVFIITLLMQFLAKPLGLIELLVIGRFLFGLVHPFSLYTPTFVSECAPIDLRGRASFASGIGFRVWIVLGPIFGIPYLLGSQDLWNWALVVPIVPSALHLIAAALIKESPKYLYIKKKDVKASSKSIKWYHGKAVDVNEVFAEYNKEASLASSADVSLKMIFSIKHLRWPFLICLATCCTVPLCGSVIVHGYSTPLLIRLGVAVEQATLYTALLIQLPSVVVSFISTAVADHFGRRPLLLIGYGVSIVGLCLVFVADLLLSVSELSATVICLAGLVLIGLGVSFGPGFMYLIFPGELCPTAVRSFIVGRIQIAYWILPVVIGLTFPVLDNAIGGFAVLPQIVLSAFLWMFLWRYTPETKGKTVEEISQTWNSSEATKEKEATSRRDTPSFHSTSM